MNTTTFPIARRRGGILLTAMILAFCLALALTGYLSMTKSMLRNANRNLYLTASLDLAETGLEQAMWALNAAASDNTDAWKDWTTEDGNAWRRFADFGYIGNDTGYVNVYVSNYARPGATIVTRSVITLADGQVIEKWVKARLKGRSLFEFGLVAREPFTAGGGNVFDSWISDPDGDPDTASVPYSSGIARSNGSVATTSTATPAIELNGSAKVYGKVSVGTDTGASILYGALGGAATGWNPTSVNWKAGLKQNWGSTVGVKGDPSEYLRQDYLITGFSATFEAITAPSDPADFLVGSYTLSYNDAAKNNAYVNKETLGQAGKSQTYMMNKLTVKADGKLTIAGDVTVVLPPSGQTTFEIIQGGSLSLANGASLKIYTPGNIAVTGGASAGIVNNNATDSVQIWSTRASGSTGQTINLAGSGAFRGVIYAPEAEFTIPGGTNFYGAAVVRKFTMSGSGSLHYDESLKNFAGGGSAPVALASYQELTTAEDREDYVQALTF